jgi:hypothetical protein
LWQFDFRYNARKIEDGERTALAIPKANGKASNLMPIKSGKQKKKPHKTPAPKPEVLKIEGNWKDAIKQALRKKHPDAGWPKD